jgi:hypothetical protein
MKLQDLHGTSGFVVTDGASFRRLCDCIARIPGVAFTDRRRFFWGSGDERAEFTFRGFQFTVSCDWEGDYWVKPKDESSSPPEVHEVREHVARFIGQHRGWIDRLRSCFE